LKTGIKAVLFDCDGTILDNKKIQHRLYRQMINKFRLKGHQELNGGNIVIWLKSLGWSIQKIKQFLRHLVDSELRANVKIFRGTNEVLIYLKERGILTSIVTNRSTCLEYFQILESARLDTRLIDLYLNCDPLPPRFDHRKKPPQNHFSTLYPKPNVKFITPILTKLEILNGFPKSVLMIGDHMVDFQLAQKLGFCFVGVLSGAIKRNCEWRNIGHKGLVIQNVSELINNLNKI